MLRLALFASHLSNRRRASDSVFYLSSSVLNKTTVVVLKRRRFSSSSFGMESFTIKLKRTDYSISVLTRLWAMVGLLKLGEGASVRL